MARATAVALFLFPLSLTGALVILYNYNSMLRFALIMALLAGAGPAGAAFEEAATDARCFGMGGAGVALADHPQAGWHNPALPAWCALQGAAAGAALPFGIGDLAATAAAASCQRGDWGVGALLVTAGNALYRESTAGLSVSRLCYGRIAAGIAVNGHHLGIERFGSAATAGLDAGLAGSPIDNLTLAVAARNINRPAIGAGGEEIAQILSWGAAFAPAAPLTLSVQVQSQKGWPAQIRIGQEYRWRGILALRAGFCDRPDQASIGAGLAWGRWRIDYAARTHPVLDLSHCLSLQCRTGRSSRVAGAVPEIGVRTDPRTLARLDLNTAGRADLLLLPGIGGATADRIAALRDSLGGLGSLNDLLAVPGITQRDLERIAPYTVQELRPAVSAPRVVDINTATAEELCTLPGIGPGTARGIIDHRTQHGPFRSVDALADVPGIGRARLERIRELVTAGQ